MGAKFRISVIEIPRRVRFLFPASDELLARGAYARCGNALAVHAISSSLREDCRRARDDLKGLFHAREAAHGRSFREHDDGAARIVAFSAHPYVGSIEPERPVFSTRTKT